MPRIVLQLHVAATPERCFDLSRDIDLHVASLEHTGERAVAGKTSGLIELDEEVTFEGRHFGLRLRHTSRITAFDRPRHFRDEMVRGHFKHFRHDHRFEAIDGGTRITDELDYAAPLGPVGRLVEALFLTRYLRRLLEQRNEVVRRAAEAEPRRSTLLSTETNNR